MIILGINAYHGDAAAAIVREGQLIAAAEEERFNRIKHCAGFPTRAIQYCLQAAGISIEDVQHIGISRNPSAHLHKKILALSKRIGQKGAAAGLQSQPTRARRQTGPDVGIAEPAESAESQITLGDKNGAQPNGHGGGLARQVTDRLKNAVKVLDLKAELARALSVPAKRITAQFHNVEHHRAHLASSFYVSPFERAALLSLDGFGDFISTMWARGEGDSIEVLGQVEYPHSLGILYTAVTQFIGFPHYGDEGKVMGLAPYGKPRFIKQFRDIIRTTGAGQFRLNLDYFRHHAEGVDMTWEQGSPVIGRIFSEEFARTF